jgi:hypothetical protein
MPRCSSRIGGVSEDLRGLRVAVEGFVRGAEGPVVQVTRRVFARGRCAGNADPGKTLEGAGGSGLSVVLGRPPRLAGGTIGAINAHSRSVKPLGNRKRSRLCSLRAIAVQVIGNPI